MQQEIRVLVVVVVVAEKQVIQVVLVVLVLSLLSILLHQVSRYLAGHLATQQLQVLWKLLP
jgi:hypothetical protein